MHTFSDNIRFWKIRDEKGNDEAHCNFLCQKCEQMYKFVVEKHKSEKDTNRQINEKKQELMKIECSRHYGF